MQLGQNCLQLAERGIGMLRGGFHDIPSPFFWEDMSVATKTSWDYLLQTAQLILCRWSQFGSEDNVAQVVTLVKDQLALNCC